MLADRKYLRRLIWDALMAALCFILRLLLAPLPNVQPVTVLLIFVCWYLSAKDSILIASLTIVISNLFLGFGPWTLAQITAYCILILISKLFAPFLKREGYLIQAFYMIAIGFLYGLIISLIQAPFYGIQHFWVYYFNGVLFDAYHGIGNLIFFLLLQPIIPPLIQKYRF
ncbi:ECF transporter S component [Eremococcus coleocola]|uniref:Rod shape-determining protein MreD n=1 Tax=Eremococcus coleocola ACS-139-V-Col8 TaxID=908337 RepID=E4KMI5_9LACT|nr:ECF transporter S component [Eremococcus coleocola]EFR31848.1 hypothetical protein HMPREF9257_0283 [Eremococcus coleocola ACS-139-V-Col8]